MRATRSYLLALSPLVLLAACGDESDASTTNRTARAPDAAEVVSANDGQWLNLTGSVVSTAPNSFMLDYGAGNIRVEMDDWDWFQEGRLLKAGDRVTVSGLADRDLFLAKRVEANSVYVHNLNTIFFASGADEESMRARSATAGAPAQYADFTGVVTAVEGREFTLGTGPAAIRVDTSLLADNPLDSQGQHRVKVGDRVLVWGDIDLEPAENAELKARGLLSIVGGRPAAGSGAVQSGAAQPAAAATGNSA